MRSIRVGARTRYRHLGLVAALLCAAPAMAQDTAWLDALLQRYRIAPAGFSLYAHEVGQPAPLVSFGADIPRNPASTMKLLTTLVALEELGPAYIWKTEAYTAGVVKDGRLTGDLYLKGYGDPYLITESFWGLLNGVRQMGVKHIAGDLVLDGSYLQPDGDGPADFDGQSWRAYNTLPSALLLNFQAINLRFVPDSKQRRLTVFADPHPDNLVIDNRARLTGAACRGGWGRQLNLQFVHAPGRHTIKIAGAYPAACGERDIYRVLSDAPAHVFGVFKSLWQQQGGSIDGGLREALLPAAAQRLYGVDSRPLSDILRSINKYSNNVMTRQLVLTLGAERKGVPGTTANGLAVIRDWLRREGFDFPELVLENGVGLSRIEQISARHLGALLLRGYNGRYMPEYLSSLPIAGIDGTLQKRFVNTALQGRVHAKTGSIDNVKSLAGYVLDAQGRRVAVAMVHNGAAADTYAAEQLQEAVLQRLYTRP